MKQRSSTLIALMALFFISPLSFASIPVEVLGAVSRPGVQQLPDGTRLSAAAIAAQPNGHAYMIGAALLRRESRLGQSRLKAGLMFDLEALTNSSSPNTVAAAERLTLTFSPMAITGRLPQLLDPRPLEVTRKLDRPAEAGDVLIYPARPNWVRVVGAVERNCELPHRPLQAPETYRHECQRLPAASTDELYVIHPDGTTEKLGIALWNRSPASTLAPGAMIYVPLAASAIRDVAPDVNEDAVRFLATQVLDAPGVSD